MNQLDITVLQKSIENKGFAILTDVFTSAQFEDFRSSLDVKDFECQESSAGRRNLLAHESVRSLARSPELQRVIKPLLGNRTFAVRGLLFDKNPDANWKVPFHQDLTIAVKEEVMIGNYGPWSIKAGVLHVQPPVEISENMLTARIHLDNCSISNGALRVLPGSHLNGRLSACSNYLLCPPIRVNRFASKFHL